MTAPDPRLDEIQARAEGLTDLCPEYLRQGIRHLQRNCDIYCNEAEENDEHDCRQPDRYDGDRMAAVLADIPFLMAELRKAREALARVEDLAGEFQSEATASRAVVTNVTYSERRLSDIDMQTVAEHKQRSTIADNHAARIRAAVAAANGDGNG